MYFAEGRVTNQWHEHGAAGRAISRGTSSAAARLCQSFAQRSDSPPAMRRVLNSPKSHQPKRIRDSAKISGWTNRHQIRARATAFGVHDLSSFVLADAGRWCIKMMARGGVLNGRIASPAKTLRWAHPMLSRGFRWQLRSFRPTRATATSKRFDVLSN